MKKIILLMIFIPSLSFGGNSDFSVDSQGNLIVDGKQHTKTADVIVDNQGNIIVDGKAYTSKNGEITVDANNNVYVDGKPAKKVNTLTFDANGNPIVDGKVYQSKKEVIVDANGNVYVDGKLHKTVDNPDNANKSSSNNEACAAVVCLTNIKLALGQTCDSSIKAYFKVKKKRHGHFSPSRTFNARGNWLDQCKEAKSKDKIFIQALYGLLPGKP